MRTAAKWVVAILAFLLLVPCAAYVCFFVRITPPLSIKVVDAINGKPLGNMDVCMQAVDDGFGQKRALRSELLSTDAKGKVFFWPTINTLPLLGHWDGYSIQVSDPKSNFSLHCGSRVGFEFSDFPDRVVASITDGTQYFPAEMVEQTVPRQRFLPWTNIQHADFGMKLNLVNLIPILANAKACDQIRNSQPAEECKQLNAEAESAVLQDLVPMYFGGMHRVALEPFNDGPSPNHFGYKATYSSASIPSEGLLITIERFEDARIAMKHLADFSRAIPNYDHTIAIEDEIVPGQKIEWIKKPTSASALWVSGNRLIAITNFIPGVSYPPTFERQYVMEWLRRNPSTMDSRPF
jgi:hypothetical protein